MLPVVEWQQGTSELPDVLGLVQGVTVKKRVIALRKNGAYFFHGHLC